MESNGDSIVGCCPRKQIARDLLTGELIEWQIGIDRLDDPVSPSPGEGPRKINDAAAGFSEAGPIEPMSSPSLAKMRRREQPIDQPLVGARARVGQEVTHFLLRRRQ